MSLRLEDIHIRKPNRIELSSDLDFIICPSQFEGSYLASTATVQMPLLVFLNVKPFLAEMLPLLAPGSYILPVILLRG